MYSVVNVLINYLNKGDSCYNQKIVTYPALKKLKWEDLNFEASLAL